jgi:1-phosphatidylinositol phosphodiesterase
MNKYNREDLTAYQWMAATTELDNLTLRELTLPGTHNAGCDWEASYPLNRPKNWLACQDVSFYSQLNRGARALDLRLICDNDGQGLENFRFQHNDNRSSRNLGDLVRDVKAFFERSPDEFIIFDFHQLASGDSAFNYAEFKQLMLTHLGDRMIPENNRYLTLGQLKKISPLQRLLVAAPLPRETKDSRFLPLIDHYWIGKQFVNTSDLNRYIGDVLLNPPSKWYFWSLSATTYSLGGPQRILNELDLWFDPNKTDWAKHCNIINFDFIKNSNIVFFCQIANVQKALDKAVALRPQAG